ncbi:TPA: hypothetical protein ACOSSI_005357, partial [Escherichia coli]
CFNKSKGVLITGSKLKAFRNPQPSWGFSVHKNNGRAIRPFQYLTHMCFGLVIIRLYVFYPGMG